jgi:hypothetical protein
VTNQDPFQQTQQAPTTPIYQQYQVPAGYQPYVVAQPKVNGLAVASMVLGICGLLFGWLYVIPCILGVVFGAVALRKINAEGLAGRGMAIAGLVCGIIGTAFWGLMLLLAASA